MVGLRSDLPIEEHPLAPFLPEGARVLVLGSFPPPRARWSMDFYYPNPQNDFWRVVGLVFFGDKEHFARGPEEAGSAGPAGRRGFDEAAIRAFCAGRGIALSDTAEAVVRLAGNASDDALHIARRRDIPSLLVTLPTCHAVVTTGQKATDTLFETLREAGAVSADGQPLRPPAVGGFIEAVFGAESALADRTVRLWRLPSTSRAYPLALESKAEAYARMFMQEGLL